MKNISDTGVTAPAIVEDQLVLPETTDGLTLADYVPVLRRYRDINSSMVFDYHDKKGNAAARSHVAKIRRVKAPINEIHKRLKADYKAIVDQMDADRREALAVVEEMIEYHDKHLRAVAEEEAKEAERRHGLKLNGRFAKRKNALHARRRRLKQRPGMRKNRNAGKKNKPSQIWRISSASIG